MNPLTLDTQTQVFFYEQDFYVLSNFSSFQVKFNGVTFATSEHAYHYQRFCYGGDSSASETGKELCGMLLDTSSAHEAFTLAQLNKRLQRPDWDEIKFDVMKQILHAKVEQHEYVRRKLLQTHHRELVENSWRDNVWGWGPNRDGQNMLGKLWMEVRDELKFKILTSPQGFEREYKNIWTDPVMIATAKEALARGDAEVLTSVTKSVDGRSMSCNYTLIADIPADLLEEEEGPEFIDGIDPSSGFYLDDYWLGLVRNEDGSVTLRNARGTPLASLPPQQDGTAC